MAGGGGLQVNHRKIQNTKQTKTTAGYQNLQIKSKQATKLKAGGISRGYTTLQSLVRETELSKFPVSTDPISRTAQTVVL